MRRHNFESGEHIEYLCQLFGLGIAVLRTVVAHVQKERQFTVDQYFAQLYHARVVDVNLLDVGMDLHAAQSQLNTAVDFTGEVFVVLVHTGKADSFKSVRP